MCRTSSHVASPPQDAPSISRSLRLFLHTKKTILHFSKVASSSWTRLNHFPAKQFCRFLRWWRVDDTTWQRLLFSMACSRTHLALLLRDKTMHYWCATLASPSSTSFVFALNLWLCCQASNRNLSICIDCWWFYCLCAWPCRSSVWLKMPN